MRMKRFECRLFERTRWRRWVSTASPESLCEECKAGSKHERAHVPRPGDKRKRVSEEGHSSKAATNRAPPLLAERVGRAMTAAWEGA